MAEIKTRVYEVKNTAGEIVALVEAVSNVQVFAHMARASFSVTPATGKALYNAGVRGITVETANSITKEAIGSSGDLPKIEEQV